jgi:hypothetical protein
MVFTPLLVPLYVYNSVAVRYMTCLHTTHEGPKTPFLGVFSKASLWPNVGKFWSAPYRKTRRSQLIDPFFDVFWAQNCVVECRRLHHTFTVRAYNFRCVAYARRRKVIKIWWFSHPFPRRVLTCVMQGMWFSCLMCITLHFMLRLRVRYLCVNKNSVFRAMVRDASDPINYHKFQTP